MTPLHPIANKIAARIWINYLNPMNRGRQDLTQQDVQEIADEIAREWLGDQVDNHLCHRILKNQDDLVTQKAEFKDCLQLYQNKEWCEHIIWHHGSDKLNPTCGFWHFDEIKRGTYSVLVKDDWNQCPICGKERP